MTKSISNNQYIEICEMPEEDLAGRVKIKMSALEIVPDNSRFNSNGISWLEEYVLANLDSAIGMPYVVSWFDEKNQIPSDHGTMSYDEDGNLQFDGVSVGTVLEAYIEDVEIDGETKKLLMTEGFLYSQRYNLFIKWIKEEIKNGKVFGSIEINGKGKSKTIEYLDGATNEDGSMKDGRVPSVFDFSGLSILYLVEPADRNSVVFEVNSKEGDSLKMSKDIFNKNIINKGVTIELNKLSYDDIACLITRAFNKAMGNDSEYYYDFNYEIYRFYPETNEVVFRKYQDTGKYYMTKYEIKNTEINIGEISQVEEDWVPISNSQPVEVNINKIKDNIINKGGQENMNIEELKAKITELTNQSNELNAKITELNSVNVEKDNKIAELTETIVNVNKSLEEVNAKYNALEVECNGYKEEKEKMEIEKKQAEINAYFETEIPKNNFEEAEINSLKEYIEKCDLEGLKKAEADLIVKKFKEGKIAEIEINSKKEGNIFFHTKEEKLDDIEVGKSLFK